MNSTKTVPEGIQINELLERYGLGDAFDNMILKQVLARNLPRGSEAEKFIFSNLDELKAHVTPHKTDSTTDEELKTLITDWLAEQSANPSPP